MYARLLAVIGCFCSSIVFSQQDQPLDPQKKSLSALRTDQRPVLDGLLDESFWQHAAVATDFVVNQPNPGARPSQRSEVRVVYTDWGLYVGAMLYDTEADSIQQEITQRDGLGNTDWFGVFIDSYRDGINGFGFIVTPADVQFDAKYSTFGEDESWDAVWNNKAVRLENGWSVEIEIPYSAIRFPDRADQVWHINFGRLVRRSQEKGFWSEVDPQQQGFLNQSGYLRDIHNIKAPPRIQATPFVAVYGNHRYDESAGFRNDFSSSINGGMDVKIGLSDAFTLDMTLIPDFGEARSDNQVLNLSPFEVRFSENRAFFTEGTELFNKGNLFYSRRIGGTPLRRSEVSDQLADGEEIVENPVRSQLYNATKISGRTAKGLGIGFFNATSGRTVARIRNQEGGYREFETDPLTNYNVLVLDQNLPNNSYATLINTTVLRSGSAYDANVTGTEFSLRNKANSYELRGGGALSQLYFGDSTSLGHRASLGIRKTSGNVQWAVNYLEESDTYDPNDLGILFANNERSVDGFIEYNQFEPFGGFNRGSVGFYAEYSRLYNPDEFTSVGLNLFAYAQGKNFWEYNVWGFVQPFGNYDYFEPREPGRYVRNPVGGEAGFWIGTDSRKKLRLTANGNFFARDREAQYNLFLRTRARYRFSDKYNLTFGLSRRNGNRELGFVDKIITEVRDPGTEVFQEERDIIIGRRDRITTEVSLNSGYTFNANMALSFRLRHYWSTAIYDRFFLLEEDGSFGNTEYNDQHDVDYNAFNIDLIYRWRFAPGSDLIIVYKNSITSFSDQPQLSYTKNLKNLWDAPQDNQLSVKLVYFLDYASLFRS